MRILIRSLKFKKKSLPVPFFHIVDTAQYGTLLKGRIRIWSKLTGFEWNTDYKEEIFYIVKLPTKAGLPLYFRATAPMSPGAGADIL